MLKPVVPRQRGCEGISWCVYIVLVWVFSCQGGAFIFSSVCECKRLDVQVHDVKRSASKRGEGDMK